MEINSKPYIVRVSSSYDAKWEIKYFRKEIKKPYHYLSTTRYIQTAFGFMTLDEAAQFAEYATSVWVGLKFTATPRMEVK